MFLVLILPVISLMIGSLLGQKFYFIYRNSQDVRMVSCGFIFFVLSILSLSIYDKKIRNKKNTHRKIISIDIQNNIDPITK